MRHFFLFLFFTASHLAFSQNHTLDSLYTALENHQQYDTTRVKILIRICHLEYTSHPEKNKMYAEEALQISKQINFIKGIGAANRYISFYHWVIGDYGEALKYAYEMLRANEISSFSGGVGQAYQLIGLIHHEEHNFDNAKQSYEKALGAYQKEKLKRDIGYCYNSLGVLSLDQKKNAEAKEYFLMALEIRKEIKDENGLGQTYSNLGLVYKNMKDYDEAEKYYKMSKSSGEKFNNQYRLAVYHANVGDLYMLKGNYDESKFNLLEAIKIAKSMHQKSILKEVYGNLTRLEWKKGRFENALKYFELESAYRDSIYTEEKAIQMANIQTRYETEKKDQAIQLFERDKKIQTLWTNIIIASLVLLAIGIYFLQRYRERKNRYILNLEIDRLTTRYKYISEKYIDILSGEEGKKIIETPDQRLLKRAIEVVQGNMSDPSFGVEKMAKEMGMSQTNMHRKLKAITGFPPSELIKNIRLRKAAQLILNQENSVAQISFMVGFEDQSYFSKSFKKEFGIPPSRYLPSRQVELSNNK